MSSYNRAGPIWGGCIAAIIGLAFCVFMLFGHSEQLCITAGCSLMDTVRVAGISLWWFGAAAFIILLILCILPYASLALAAAALVLVVDCLLLLVMLFSVQCSPCLIVALIFAVTFFVIRTTIHLRRHTRRRSILLLIWIILFFANLFPLGSQYLGVWTLAGPPDAPVRMYFSPSCPTCREALEEAEAMPAGVVAYIPVAENHLDVPVILRMQKALEADTSSRPSMTAALRTALSDFNSSSWGGLAIKDLAATGWRVLRNRSHALTSGATVIPFFTMNGKPQMPGTRNTPLQLTIPQNGSISTPQDAPMPSFAPTLPGFGPDSFQGCGGANGDPCE